MISLTCQPCNQFVVGGCVHTPSPTGAVAPPVEHGHTSGHVGCPGWTAGYRPGAVKPCSARNSHRGQETLQITETNATDP